MANGQPHPRATVTPRGRAIGHFKGAKQAAHQLGAHADAGIAYRHVPVTVAIGLFIQRDAQADLAFGGKFQCIGQQVAQHLAQAVAVPFQPGQAVRALQPQAQAFGIGTDAILRQQAVQQRGHVYRVAPQGKVAILDRGQIQNIADQHHLCLGAFLQGMQQLALGRRQRRGGQQLGHAHHPVHGRAQLVAHHRQKLGFGAHAGLGQRQCLAQLQRALGHLFFQLVRRLGQLAVGRIQRQALGLQQTLGLLPGRVFAGQPFFQALDNVRVTHVFSRIKRTVVPSASSASRCRCSCPCSP